MNKINYVSYDSLSEDEKKLLQKAIMVLDNSYSPYSNYPVGAALMTEDNNIFAGTNVENASYGLSTCAEVGAIQSAVAHGYRNFKTIAIVAGLKGQKQLPTPCGRCRQWIQEFSEIPPRDIQVIMANRDLTVVGKAGIYDLLPEPFGSDNLQEK